VRQGFVELSQFAQGVAEVVVVGGEIRAHLHGPAELLDGLRVLSQSLQGQAKVAERFGVIAPQAQRHAAAAGRPLELAQGAISLGQVGVEGRDVRPQGHGPTDLLDGAGMLALLMVQHPEQVQRIGIFLFARQDLLVQLGR